MRVVGPGNPAGPVAATLEWLAWLPGRRKNSPRRDRQQIRATAVK